MTIRQLPVPEASTVTDEQLTAMESAAYLATGERILLSRAGEKDFELVLRDSHEYAANIDCGQLESPSALLPKICMVVKEMIEQRQNKRANQGLDGLRGLHGGKKRKR